MDTLSPEGPADISLSRRALVAAESSRNHVSGIRGTRSERERLINAAVRAARLLLAECDSAGSARRVVCGMLVRRMATERGMHSGLAGPACSPEGAAEDAVRIIDDCGTLDAEAIGAAYEGLLALGEDGERKRSGAYYTPPNIVREVLEASLRPVMRERLADAHTRAERERALLSLRLCDPACGSGNFVLAAARMLAREVARISGRSEGEALREVARSCVYGVDIDPAATELCRALLWVEAGDATLPHDAFDSHILCAESLLGMRWPDDFPRVFSDRGFDVVVGNPPYVDSEAMVKERGETRRCIAAAYESARGNWDLCVPFVELASRITRPSGRFALVVPQRLLASDYAASIQQLLLRLTPERISRFEEERGFDGASVRIAVVAVRNTPGTGSARIPFLTHDADGARKERRVTLASMRALPAGYMGSAAALGDGRMAALFERCAPLAAVADVSDGATTAQAYALGAYMHEASGDEDEVRVVNTGTIDPFALRWGERTMRYLGQRLLRPVIARADLLRIAQRRLEQAERTKIVIAGMGARIEAAVAPAGVLCGKSAVLVLPREDICSYALNVVLNSTLISDVYRAVFGGRGFGQRAMAIGPRQVERLPAPEATWLAHRSQLSRLGRLLHERRLTPRRREHVVAAAERRVRAAFGL